MRVVVLAALAVLTAASALGASAEPVNLTRQSEGYVYFNRPGADIPTMHAALWACLRTISGRGAVPGYDPVGGMVGGLIAAGNQYSMESVNLENCMVVRGWRVVRLADAEGARLAGLAQAPLAEALTSWVGADPPHGVIVRRWDNDAAKVATVVSGMPRMLSRPSLSLRSLPPSEPGAAKAPPAQGLPHGSAGPRPYNMQIFAPATKAQLAKDLPPGSALLIVTMANGAPKGMAWVTLARLGPDDGSPAWAADKRPDWMMMSLPKTQKGGVAGAGGSLTQAYILPAGRWLIFGVSDVLTLCMGAPFIDLQPGDVVHTGSIDFGRDGLPIDPAAAPAAAFLTGQPALLSRLRTAAWTNGATVPCGGGFQYALEYPEMPYAPGYVKGEPLGNGADGG